MEKHLNHYLVLLVILNLGVGMFYFLRFNQTYQIMVMMMTGIAYVLWGIIHHWQEEDLHPKIILEYVLIALLANLIVLSLLFRA